MHLRSIPFLFPIILVAAVECAADPPDVPNPLPPRIDVHAHFVPDFYREALIASGNSQPDGMPEIPEWSPEDHLKLMQTANIQKSILSISSPGTHLFPDNETHGIELARQCNAYAADLKKQHPDQFGFWASLPLPNVDAALEEIDKAIEDGCDGFVLETNYMGHYLGDAIFNPVFVKLNELGATVFVHPTSGCMGQHDGTNSTGSNTVAKALPFGNEYPAPIFEFLFDTARAAINMFYTGTVNRAPNMKFILSHVGGVFPLLFNRFVTFSSMLEDKEKLNATEVQSQLLEQFYFDIAGIVFDGSSGGNGQLKAFVEGFDIPYQRFLYGSDFPFTSNTAVAVLAARMVNGLGELFGQEERTGIYSKNAEALLE